MRQLRVRDLVCALFILLIGTSQAMGASAGRKIVIPHGVMNAALLPLWVAKDEKFFGDQGLEAELVAVKGTPTVISGLVSGHMDLGYTGGTGVLPAAAGGVDLKIVATFFNKEALTVVSRADITKTEDLRGKRLGVQSIGGANWMMSMLALERIGLEPQRDDIRVLNTGGTPTRAQALEAGSIDFTILTDVSFVRILEKRGFRILAKLPPIPFTSLGFAVDGSYRSRQGEVIESALKAVTEGVAFALAPPNKAKAIGVLMKRLEIPAPAAEVSYEDFLSTVERKPYTMMEGLKNIQRLMALKNPKVAKVDLRNVVDGSFVQKLDESGFLDRLQATYGLK